MVSKPGPVFSVSRSHLHPWRCIHSVEGAIRNMWFRRCQEADWLWKAASLLLEGVGGKGPKQREALSLSEGVLVRKALGTPVALSVSPCWKGAGGSVPVAEAAPLCRLTFVCVLIFHHCWGQRGASAESQPPLLRADLMISFKMPFVSLVVVGYRCPTPAKTPVKCGWRILCSLSKL